jgi:hypothetical protein
VVPWHDTGLQRQQTKVHYEFGRAASHTRSHGKSFRRRGPGDGYAMRCNQSRKQGGVVLPDPSLVQFMWRSVRSCIFAVGHNHLKPFEK